jgi:preprotein translocase subunit YajC
VTQYLLSLAQQTPSGQQGPGGFGTMLIPMVLIFGVMYLLVIRPQQKRQKELQKLLSDLKKGDEVVTNGGIIGRISGIKDNGEVVLQVQEQVRIRVLRSAITGLYKSSGEPAKTDAGASS